MKRSDENKQYLVKNPKIVELIESINKNLKVVDRGELELN